jgi:LytR cell envelope-related transcriptional attenuator
MSQKFPTDDFDLTNEVGGRHRARRSSLDRLLEFVQVIVAGAVLSGVGFFALQIVSNSTGVGLDVGLPVANTNQFSQANGIGVSVIDSSKSNDAASKLAQKLLDAGWNVWSASRSVNRVGEPTFAKTTTVYVTGPAAASAAKSLASSVGNFQTVESSTYSDPITIVLGLDYNK